MDDNEVPNETIENEAIIEDLAEKVNITVVKNIEHIESDIEKNLLSIMPMGYIKILLSKTIKSIPIQNIDIILLEFLITNYKNILMPIVCSSKYSISVVVNNRTSYSNKEIILSNVGELLISGISIKNNIKNYKKNLILLKVYYDEFYFNTIFITFIKNNVKHLLNSLQYTFEDKQNTFTFLKYLYNLIDYYSNYNYVHLLPKIFSDNIKLDVSLNLSSNILTNNKYNENVIKILKEFEISWFNYSDVYDLTLINDMFNAGLLLLFVKIVINGAYGSEVKGDKKNQDLKTQIDLYNKNIILQYYSYSRPNILDYITEKQLNKYIRQSVKTVSPILQELKDILDMSINNKNKISIYKKFIKKYSIEETDVSMIYDKDNNELICPHVRDSIIFDRNDIERYYIRHLSNVYCKICGAIIKDLENLSINVKEEINLYTDVNYNEKIYVWNEIVKVLPYIEISDNILISDLIKQLTIILYPVIQKHNFNISSIKTLKFTEKLIFFNIITNTCIWATFTLIKKNFPKILDIVIIAKDQKNIEDNVYNKIITLQQQNIKQYNFIGEEKIKELFYNSMLELAPAIKNIILKEKHVEEEYIYLENNPLYDYLLKVAKSGNVKYDELPHKPGNITYNNILDFIKFIKVNVYENDILNPKITEKIQSLEKQDRQTYFHYHYNFVNKKSNHFNYVANYESLVILYGTTLDKERRFHAHKWNVIRDENTGVTDFTCTICESKYKDIALSGTVNASQDKKNIINIIILQQSIINFYSYYFILCPEGNTHTFDDKWICKKCSVNIKMILEKDITYFKKYSEVYDKNTEEKKNIIFIPEYTKYIMHNVISDDTEYQKDQISLVHNVIKNTKGHVTFMSETNYIMFLKDLGLNKNDSVMVRCNKLNYFIQSILCVGLSYDIKPDITYDYNDLRLQYSYVVLQYILLDIIYKLLQNVNNKDCIGKIIKMIINYESLIKTAKESEEYSSQFAIKEDETNEPITKDEVYEDIDYTEINEDEIVEDT